MMRHENSPILSREDIVSTHSALRDVSSVFNPGGIPFNNGYLLLLRVQNRARHTVLVKAVSEDGISFQVDPEPLPLFGLEDCPHQIFHIYDPRITLIQGVYHIICAMDTNAGCFLSWFVSTDFEGLQFQGIVSDVDVRNGILFPEKIGDRYWRFERPNRVQMADGVKTGSVIVCSSSTDLKHWQIVAPVMQGNPHYWDELIGSGPPPLKTRKGWIHIYHGVATHFGSSNIYQVGVSLHDLCEPWKVISRGKYNILEPRELYEQVGQVPNVVFPSAVYVHDIDQDGFAHEDSVVYIYYGAADTCIGLAETSIKELLGDTYA